MSVLIDTQAAAVAVGRPPGTLRRWLSLGLLERHGTDPRGRTLVDLGAVYALAARMRPSRPTV